MTTVRVKACCARVSSSHLQVYTSVRHDQCDLLFPVISQTCFMLVKNLLDAALSPSARVLQCAASSRVVDGDGCGRKHWLQHLAEQWQKNNTPATRTTATGRERSVAKWIPALLPGGGCGLLLPFLRSIRGTYRSQLTSGCNGPLSIAKYNLSKCLTHAAADHSRPLATRGSLSKTT